MTRQVTHSDATTEPAWQVAYEGPTRFVATQRTHQRLCFRIKCDGGIPAGTHVRLIMGRFRSMLDNNPQRYRQWQDFQASVEGDGRLEIVQGPPGAFYEIADARVRDARIFNHYVMGVTRVVEPIAASATLVLQVQAMLTHQAPIEARVLVQAQRPGEEAYQFIGDTVELQGVPGDAAGLVARLKGSPDTRGVFALHVHAVDATGNPIEPALRADELEVDLPGSAERVDGGVRVVGDRPVRVRVRGRDRLRKFESLSNPVRAAGFNGRRVYFGGIHFHTRFSADGDRTIEQAYEYARDTLQLDFAAVTDHTPTPSWDETCRLNERYNAPGRFVTLPAWEWSTSSGHSNIYLRHPGVPAGPEHARSANHPGNAHWPDEAILVPHHTNIRSAERNAQGEHCWREFSWSLPNRRVRLVELLQTRGNFEADSLDRDWGIVTSGIGASVRDALAMGYRVGFVGGTDNHAGFPTRDPALGGSFNGMACVLADDLTRDAIWQAMNDRRTYATSGVPILAHWTVNGHEMGEEAELSGDAVRFSATLHGTAPIERVEVISNNAVVWRSHPDAFDVTFNDETLPVPTGPGAYYYLRLRQHDGHRAWLSPVWLDRRA